MEAVGDIINRYTYTGEEGEIIPDDATHIFVAANIIRARAFEFHRNIIEVICHEDVEKIEIVAFRFCPSLRRVIMRGVKIVEDCAFMHCEALMDVECDKLEIIKDGAFNYCKLLRSINLTSVRIVERDAFGNCRALTDAKFGSMLERFDERAFLFCTSLERITIPLKNGFITDNTFQGCENLNHVELVEGSLLHQIVAALHLEEWRNDMNEVIDSINQALPNAPAGEIGQYVGEKVRAIRDWIGSVLRQLGHYKADHRRLLDEDVAPFLQCILPRDIVMNSILPFLELPSNAFFE